MTNYTKGIGYGREISGSLSDCIKQAGLDYKVAMTPAYFNPTAPTGDFSQVPKRYVTYRTDNNQPFGVVGSRYAVIQNEAMFAFLEYVTDFELTNGASTSYGGWLSGKFGEEEILGEVFAPYVFLGNSFDGSRQFTVAFAPYRLSTRSFVNLSGAVYHLSIRHILNSAHRIQLAKAFIKQSTQAMSEFRDIVNATSVKRVTTEKAKDIFHHLLTDGHVKYKEENKLPRNYDIDLACLLDNFHGEKSTYAHTGYAVLLAVSKFVEEVLRNRVRTEEKHITKSLFTTNPMLAKAYHIINKL